MSSNFFDFCFPLPDIFSRSQGCDGSHGGLDREAASGTLRCSNDVATIWQLVRTTKPPATTQTPRRRAAPGRGCFKIGPSAVAAIINGPAPQVVGAPPRGRRRAGGVDKASLNRGRQRAPRRAARRVWSLFKKQQRWRSSVKAKAGGRAARHRSCARGRGAVAERESASRSTFRVKARTPDHREV